MDYWRLHPGLGVGIREGFHEVTCELKFEIEGQHLPSAHYFSPSPPLRGSRSTVKTGLDARLRHRRGRGHWRHHQPLSGHGHRWWPPGPWLPSQHLPGRSDSEYELVLRDTIQPGNRDYVMKYKSYMEKMEIDSPF